MNDKKTWVVGGLLVLGLLIAALSQLTAQRPPAARPLGGEGPVGRYAVVLVEGGNVILLDTVTGDLYRATQDDIKPHASRPRFGGGVMADKDKDKAAIRDKDFRDKEKDKDFRFNDKDRFIKDKDKG
jgi:hypothetical protein